MGVCEATRHSAAMMAVNKQVNASIVDPGFIAMVCKKLALDQREAAWLAPLTSASNFTGSSTSTAGSRIRRG